LPAQAPSQAATAAARRRQKRPLSTVVTVM
jgi:hypothetical protein